MKRLVIISALSLLAIASFISCEKEEIGGTATQSLAGQWYIRIDAVDANGNVMTDDQGSTDDYVNYFSFEHRQTILTYNTASNSANEMYLDLSMMDDDNVALCPFAAFKVLIPCNTASGTFGSADTVLNMIVYDMDYATSDTIIDTVQVKKKEVSCLKDTSVIAYDSIYVTNDTVYVIQDTTYITYDTLFVSTVDDSIYIGTKVDTILTPAVAVIDTIIHDSIGVFFAYERIDTIVSATTPVIDKIRVWNGKITTGGATTPSGMKADAIEFEFYTDGDDIGYYFDINYGLEHEPGDLRMGVSFGDLDGFDHYKVSGFRYTGFKEDE